MRYDKGVGAMGVLGLFLVLSVLLGVGLPVIKSDAHLKASDWLGFAGNIIAAAFATVAAVVAWVAAQRQLRHAAQQNSVIAYASLRDVLAAINDDAMANREAGVALGMIESEARMVAMSEALSALEVRTEIDGVEQHLKALSGALKKLEEARARPWGGAAERQVRSRLLDSINIYLAMAHINIAILMDDETTGAAFQAKFCDSTWERCDALATEFSEMIKSEMERVYVMMDEHFSGFRTSP